MSYKNEAINQLIRRKRETLNLAKQSVAEKLHMKNSQYSSVEKNFIGSKHYSRVCEILDIDVADLDALTLNDNVEVGLSLFDVGLLPMLKDKEVTLGLFRPPLHLRAWDGKLSAHAYRMVLNSSAIDQQIPAGSIIVVEPTVIPSADDLVLVLKEQQIVYGKYVILSPTETFIQTICSQEGMRRSIEISSTDVIGVIVNAVSQTYTKTR